MSVLLLGGAGYIGSELTDRFLRDDFNVTCIDILVNNNYDSVKNKKPCYKFINDDIINLEKYLTQQDEYENIIYMASPRLQDLKDESVIQDELDRLDSVIKTVKKYENDNTRFVFLSSCSVYGDTSDLVNESSPTMVTSLYSKLKIEAENRVLQENEKYSILRLSTVYGKSSCLRDDNLINSLVSDAKQGKEIEIYGADAVRPNIHINDVVEMIRHIVSRKIKHRIINVGNNSLNITKRELISLINEIVGNNKLDISFVDKGDKRNYRVDFSLLSENYLEGDGFNYEFKSYRQAIYDLYVDTINFSHEEWDSIFEYWRPNGTSKTWYLEEEGKLSIPKTWGEWNILNIEDKKKMFSKEFLKKTIFPPFHKQYAKLLGEAEIANKNHLYLIPIYTPEFFESNKEIGFECISNKFLRDVREGRCKIVLYHHMEGYSGSSGNRDLQILNDWIKKSKLPAKSIYYIHGNLKIDEIAKSRGYEFKCIGLTTFDIWIDPNAVPESPVNFFPHHNKNLFLSYNRNQREHRVYFECELLDNNLLDKGLISCGVIPAESSHLLEIHPSANKLNEMLPIELDKSLEINWANELSNEDYEKTFVSIVTETLTDKNTLFLSEKIFKPLYVGHPFLVIGNPGTLKKLKEMGYKTFDKWWDESYDDETDLYQRIRKIVGILNDLSKKEVSELERMRAEMVEILKDNQHNYRMTTASKYRLDDQHFVTEVPITKLMADIYYDKI